jgi:ribonuclease HI
MGEITALFTDGGLVSPNPSKLGGTWSWCAVDQQGEHIREVSAYLLPKQVECPGNPRINYEVVTNNDVEFYAAMRALQAMRDGWSGILASDSSVTIDRLQKIRAGVSVRSLNAGWSGIVQSCYHRLGVVKFVLLAGHPSLKDLERGYKEQPDGTQVRVSRHNKWCDEQCTELAKTYQQRVLGWDTYVQYGLDQPHDKPAQETAA